MFVGKCLFAQVTSWAWASKGLTWGIFFLFLECDQNCIKSKYFLAAYCPKVFCRPLRNNIPHQGNIFFNWGGVRGVGFGFLLSLLHPYALLCHRLLKNKKRENCQNFPFFQSIKRRSWSFESPYKSKDIPAVIVWIEFKNYRLMEGGWKYFCAIFKKVTGFTETITLFYKRFMYGSMSWNVPHQPGLNYLHCFLIDDLCVGAVLLENKRGKTEIENFCFCICQFF